MLSQMTTPTIENEIATGDRTIFNIPEANLPRFEKEIASLSKRSVRLTGSPIKPYIFGFNMVERADGTATKVYEVYLMADAPKVSGFTFVARIDHTNETGNIIRSVPNTGAMVPDYYRTAQPNCDHCGHKRMRRDTFLVREDATGEFKQIGSTCLTDFFEGQDPAKIARLAEYLGYAREIGDALEGNGEASLNDRRWISLEAFLQNAAAMVRVLGWVSGKAAYNDPSLTATKISTMQNMFTTGYREPITAADEATAEAALAWARSLGEKADPSEFEHNVAVVANATYMEARSEGIAAAIVGCYLREQQKSRTAKGPIQVGSLEGLVALFDRAAASKVKGPGITQRKVKIRLQLPDKKRIVLDMAGPTAKAPGTLNVTDGRPFGENIWYGRVTRDGAFSASPRAADADVVSITVLLAAMAADPAATAAAYGHATGNCCFCSIALTDKRSVDVGYGPHCADRMGLPWGNKRIAESV
jgi:hypothetical protein